MKKTNLCHQEDAETEMVAFCSAIDEGDASPDVAHFDEEEYIAEMRAKWRERDDRKVHK